MCGGEPGSESAIAFAFAGEWLRRFLATALSMLQKGFRVTEAADVNVNVNVNVIMNVLIVSNCHVLQLDEV